MATDMQSDGSAEGRSILFRVLPPLLLVAAGIALIFVPLATSCFETDDGVETCTSAPTIVDEEGWSPVLILLGVPLVASLIAALVNRRRAAIASAATVSLFMLLGLASVGFLLIPAAITAWFLVSRVLR